MEESLLSIIQDSAELLKFSRDESPSRLLNPLSQRPGGLEDLSEGFEHANGSFE